MTSQRSRSYRFFFLLLSLLLCVSPSFAEDATKPPAEKATRIAKVGQFAAPGLVELAGEVGRGLILTLVGLGIVVGLLKKFSGTREKQGDSPIQILARRSTAPRQSLLLVSVDGQRFLLAATADDLKLLTAIDTSARFADSLNEILVSEEPEERMFQVGNLRV